MLLEQIRTLDKRRLKEKMGHLDNDMMYAINSAIAVSFGLGEYIPVPITVTLDPESVEGGTMPEPPTGGGALM